MIKSSNNNSNKSAGMELTSSQGQNFLWSDLFESLVSAEVSSKLSEEKKSYILAQHFWLLLHTSSGWDKLYVIIIGNLLPKSKNLIQNFGHTNRLVLNTNKLPRKQSLLPKSWAWQPSWLQSLGYHKWPPYHSGKTISCTHFERTSQHSSFILSHLEKIQEGKYVS